MESCILLAEDDDDAAVLMEAAFRVARVKDRLAIVRDGRETIDYLAGNGIYQNRQKYPWPSLVLLDLRMPKVHGFGVLVWWQNQREKRPLPIVVMSALNQPSEIQRAMDLGATSYLVKPISFQDLVQVAADLRDRWLCADERRLAA